MNKPLTVMRQEFAEQMVDTINNSGLPAFVMLEVVEKCASELSALTNQQYKQDKQAYEKSLEKSEE